MRTSGASQGLRIEMSLYDHKKMGLGDATRILRLVHSEKTGDTVVLAERPDRRRVLLRRGATDERYVELDAGLPEGATLCDVTFARASEWLICLGLVHEGAGSDPVAAAISVRTRERRALAIAKRERFIATLLGPSDEADCFLAVIGEVRRVPPEIGSQLSHVVIYSVARWNVETQAVDRLDSRVGPFFPIPN